NPGLSPEQSRVADPSHSKQAVAQMVSLPNDEFEAENIERLHEDGDAPLQIFRIGNRLCQKWCVSAYVFAQRQSRYFWHESARSLEKC
ncbi:MAG TPA: hypothetical protein VHS58_10580, partial [Acetobacteraceae bacterium]|nr:hypothetical protein [Acetobacteraceae bacterium]